jgi:hypothetical protein
VLLKNISLTLEELWVAPDESLRLTDESRFTMPNLLEVAEEKFLCLQKCVGALQCTEVSSAGIR